MSSGFSRRGLWAGLFFSVAFAAIAICAPEIHAQTPAALAFGARLALPGITAPGKVTRDAAGDIFVIVPGTPAVWEIPVNGPVQIVVPSTDPAFGQSQTTKPNGFLLTSDPAGNLYLVQTFYSFNEATYEIPRNANGTYGTSTVIATGVLGGVTGNSFNTLSDIAVDGAHNIYYSNSFGIVGINSSIANTVGTGARYILGTQGTAPAHAPNSITVDAAGDVFYVDKVNAWEIPAAMAQGSQPATPTQIGSPTCSSCAALTALTTPSEIFLDTGGDIFIGNASSNIFLIPNAGSGFSSNSVTYALPNSVIKSTYTFGAVGNNGDMYLVFGGSLELYGAGKFYTGTVSVGTPIAVGTVSSTSYASPSAGYLFTQTVTLGSVGAAAPFYPYTVLNYGSSNGGTGATQVTLNTGSGSSTCVAGTTYTAGQSCTVELGYAPKDPGSFTGALVLYGCPSTGGTCSSGYTTGSVLGAIHSTSLATGSALAIDTGYATTIGTGYLTPAGVVVDNTGAMYVADPASNSVLKFAAGSSAAGTAIGTGLSEPSGVALDAAGNLYIADTGNDRVVVIPNLQTGLAAASEFKLSTGSYALSSPRGVAVDSFGNIFIADTGFQRVLEVGNPFSTAIATTPTVIASSASTPALSAPYAVALDPYNNLFIADKGANAVYEVPTAMLTTTSTPNTGSGTLVSIGSGLVAPTGVATDGSGSVYIADSGNSRIVRVPNLLGVMTTSAQSVIASGLNKPYGIATDLTADVYFTDQNAPRLAMVKRSAPSGSGATTLAFGSIATGSNATQTVTASNAGLTTALTLTTISTPAAPFTQTANTCGASLTAGNSCSLSLQYAPTATGSSTGSFTFTDNALAVTTATQNVSLTGFGSGTVASVAMAGPATAVYGNDVSFTVTAKDSGGNVAVAANGPYAVSITGTASSSASVSLTNGVGTFFLPTVGAGSYNLSVTVGGFPGTAALTVTKAPLYLTAATFSRLFDVANPTLSTAYSGFAAGDTASVVSGTAPTISTTATRLSPAGYYPITLTGGTLTAANYTITTVNGQLAVNGSVPQTILFDALPGFTGGSTVVLTGIATSGLPLSYTTSAGTITGNVLTVPATGTVVTITASQSGSTSYAAATPVVRSFTAQ